LLWAAAWEGEAVKIPALARRVPDINLACDAGWSALHRAAIRGNLDTVKALIDCGADVNVLDPKKSSPLHFAASRKECRVCEELLLHGADPLAKYEYGKTPADLAEERGFYDFAKMIRGYVSLRQSRMLKAVKVARRKL